MQFYNKKNELFKSSNIFKMVPIVRIELTADPYQGSVLPLNYIGGIYITKKNFFQVL